MEENIKSPCKNICKYNKHKICVGCFRSMEEIVRWTSYTNEEKKMVLSNITERREDNTGLGYYDDFPF